MWWFKNFTYIWLFRMSGSSWGSPVPVQCSVVFVDERSLGWHLICCDPSYCGRNFSYLSSKAGQGQDDSFKSLSKSSGVSWLKPFIERKRERARERAASYEEVEVKVIWRLIVENERNKFGGTSPQRHSYEQPRPPLIVAVTTECKLKRC